MLRERLFVYLPSFIDSARDPVRRWFCPYSAQVIGFLTYHPAVRATLDVHELDFDRPRDALIALLGEANQAAPMLVLHEAAPSIALEGVHVAEANGRRFIAKTVEILRYLAATRGVPWPH